MFKKILLFALSSCLLAVGAFLLQSCFSPSGVSYGTSGISISGLWEGTWTFQSGTWANKTYNLAIIFDEPKGGGIIGSAKLYDPRVERHDLAAVFGSLSGNSLTLYIGHWMGVPTFQALGTISGDTISGTFELPGSGVKETGSWQVTRTYPYYTQGSS